MSALPSWVKNIGIVVTVILIVLGVATAFREGCATVTKPLAPPGPSYQKDSPPLPLKGSGRADVLPVPAPRAPAYYPPGPPVLPWDRQNLLNDHGDLVIDTKYNEGDILITLTPEHPSITLPFPMPCWVRIPDRYRAWYRTQHTMRVKLVEEPFGGDPRPEEAHQQRYSYLFWYQPLEKPGHGESIELWLVPVARK